MTVSYEKTKAQLLEAILIHVAFDGWSEASFHAAIRDAGVAPAVARAVCPRGAVDLAVAYHLEGDRLMLDRLAAEDLSALKFRDKVAAAVRFRLEAVSDKEAVRRGATLFALPIYAADGARLVWGTADKIWTALGDTSEDVNWYTKRASLSAVYSSTVLYWLGDDSPDHAATWEFLDRRIGEVMQIEKLKAQARANPILSKLMAGPEWLGSRIRAPRRMSAEDLPGRWTTPDGQA
jgi:ubiquinone biosynthesis protein COQ9